MSNTHEPRTYRSNDGCCICKAKSCSSGFVDSRKYETDAKLCFDLKYIRQGEICNACVLLIKRFQRLPCGNQRNWSHVVDANAASGPGCSKIQTKYKSERINSRAALAKNALHTKNSQSVSSSKGAGVGEGDANAVNNTASYAPEKFTKILKKTKKIRNSAPSAHTSKRKSTNNRWSQSGLPPTPDSLDSDYEDTRIHMSVAGNQGSGGNCTVVQFQTQTRASAYRAQAAAEARKSLVKMGSKKRKLLLPRKNRRSLEQEQSIDFFDKEEWQERKSCCGLVHECTVLGGAILIQTKNYKLCEKHRRKTVESHNDLMETTTSAVAAAAENRATTTVMPLQKQIVQTVPAVVQLKPLPAQAASISLTSSTSCLTSNNNNIKMLSTLSATSTTSSTPITTPTPVLKKHHLFYKRQSECFPQGDMVPNIQNTINNNTDSSTALTAAAVTTPITTQVVIKTESEFNPPTLQHQQLHYAQISKNSSNSTSSLERINDHTISASNSTTILPKTSSSLSISILSPTSSSTMPQMPKHSLAKVTTISPTLTSINCATTSSGNTAGLPLAKPNGFLHKIKAANTGKIVKQSLEKFNTAVRLKTSDINDVKNIIKTVDKSFILTKPPAPVTQLVPSNATNTNTSTAATVTTTQYQNLTAYNVTVQQQPSLTTAPLSATSPTSSISSTASNTKFSDNSSDSGFDENMLDRKSASPLQEDYEKKLLSHPGIQTMFLASGVQIQGQVQNLLLTGNEMAEKILQNRKYGGGSSTSSKITFSSF